ncbi:hypothetical protein KR018_001273, partial [Drosophila ironensis]
MEYYLKHVETGGKFYLAYGPNIIGRDPHCTWMLDFSCMSRKHAIIIVADEGVCIQNTKAHNCTFINFDRIGSDILPLHVGDVISFGVDPIVVEDLSSEYGIFTLRVAE